MDQKRQLLCCCFFMGLQLLNATQAAIMKSVCCLVPLHVRVSLTLSRAPPLVLRAVPVIQISTTMELVVCPLTSAAVISMAKPIK